jgi:hypothetical protein
MHKISTMLKKLTLVLSIILAAFTFVSAQEKVIDAKKELKELEKKADAPEGWKRAGGFGLDFSTLSLINPRAGAGDNRIGFGGIFNYNANLTRGKYIWDNRFNAQLALAKISEDPLTKANDALQLTSQFGYAFAPKWYAALLGDFQSQLLSTYGKNYLLETPFENNDTTKFERGAKFLAPAIFKVAPGVIYKHSANLSFLFSPVAIKGVVVNDDKIAAKNAFIPKTAKNNKFDFQLGAQLRADFTKKFFNDKIAYTTTLDLYSNYLRTPENIDVEWYHSLDFVLFKNIGVNFKSDWFYDHDILVFKGGDLKKPGYGTFFRNALFLKYNQVF